VKSTVVLVKRANEKHDAELEKTTKKIYQEDFKAVNLQEAKTYAEKQGFLRYNEKEDKYENISLFCDLKELSHFGAGIHLYFYFLKFFAILFFILFILTIIPLYYNFKGGGLGTGADGKHHYLLMFSFANLGLR